MSRCEVVFLKVVYSATLYNLHRTLSNDNRTRDDCDINFWKQRSTNYVRKYEKAKSKLHCTLHLHFKSPLSWRAWYTRFKSLEIYFRIESRRRTDVTLRGSDACIDQQTPSPSSLALSLSLSPICSQLFPAKLFAFQSAPFCAGRLFAPLNARALKKIEFCRRRELRSLSLSTL